ncbi:helix-turn-helix domain-containing protein [Pseudonocardia pini]|uniref:helix-turn-helix domain-containing protein n=1 Tax=Pseudonocardia pini TaxID=2758030 RepID=UPI0015F1120D|nr:helix-turn-helix transcriptional regulator [Pseudonocardia pini]
MAPQQGPAGPRRRLGAELRRLRLKADMTLDEVAELMTCSTSKISRLETGKGIPKMPDVNELIRIYGVSADAERDMLHRLVREGRTHGWWEPFVEGVQPEKFVMDAPARYPSLEAEATSVSSFDLAFLHGLLQTRDYARAVLAALLPHHGRRAIEKLVELRMERQRALDRPDPMHLQVVLDEGILVREAGGRAVMRRQLEVLAEQAARPNVDLRVLPFSAGLDRAHLGEFVLLGFADPSVSDVVYVEGPSGESYLDAPADVELYEHVFGEVAERALDPAASLDRIEQHLSSPERTRS